MKAKTKKIFVLLLALVFAACLSVTVVYAANYVSYKVEKQPGDDQFDFSGNYTPPELTIDGKDDDEQWENAVTLASLGSSPAATMTVKFYRGEEALFFFFDVKDSVLLTQGDTNDDNVTRGDSVEVYLDTELDHASKPQTDDYQINLGIHGKTRIMQGAGSQWGGWNGLIDYAVQLDGTLNDGTEKNDTGYTVELMVPYAQVGIEKTDDIGISFGLVDKVGEGNAVSTDFNWYGWTYEGLFSEPQSPSNYIVLRADDTLCKFDDLPMPAATVAGYVTDQATGNPISGVTVSLNDGEKTATTDAQGYYAIAEVSSDAAVSVSFDKDGYYDYTVTYTREELREVRGGVVTKQIQLLSEAAAKKTTVGGTVKNIINGVVEGVTVSVQGTTMSAQTDSDGTFSIAEVPVVGEITLTFAKTGYETSSVTVGEEVAEVDGTTSFGEVSLNLAFNDETVTMGGGRGINLFDIKTTRTLAGLYFKFTTTTKFEANEWAEFFVYAGSNDVKPFGLQLKAEGNIGYDSRFASFTPEQLALVNYEVLQNDDPATGATLILEIPYSVMGMQPTDAFGFTGGVSGYNTSGAKDWDGLGYDGFRDPTIKTSYVRVNMNNDIYTADSNAIKVTIAGNAGQAGVTVACGSVDTVSGSDGAYSLTIDQPSAEVQVVFSKLGYETVSKSVSPTDFGSSLSATVNATLTEKKVTIGGTVVDGDGEPLAGVDVAIEGTQTNMTTGDDGRFSFTEVGAAQEVRLVFEAAGYTTVNKSFTVEQLSGEDLTALSVTMVSSSVTTDLSGTVANLLGNVEGATVKVVGMDFETTSGANGAFTLADVPVTDVQLEISKAGYNTEIYTVSAGELTEGSSQIGSFDLKLAYAEMGVFGDLNELHSAFKGYVTRGINAFEFKFVSEKQVFNEGDRIELFVSTKGTNVKGARTLTDYLFYLNATGAITIVNWDETRTGATKNERVSEGMTLSVEKVGTGTQVVFILPYAFFGQVNGDNAVAATEVIGITAGQWTQAGNAWDGWDYVCGTSYNDINYVAPEITKDYMRIDKYNNLYWCEFNTEADLVGKNIRFGTALEGKADNFYASVSRDDSGITFDVIAFGDFIADEFMLVYFDFGATGGTEWTCGEEDYQFKVYGDGTVYYKKSTWPWWNKKAGTVMEGTTVAITRENGVTSFSFTVAYEFVGIGASDEFGFAVREAAENNSDDYLLYDPWYDCYVNGQQIDAATQSQYARVDADGRVFFAQA